MEDLSDGKAVPCPGNRKTGLTDPLNQRRFIFLNSANLCALCWICARCTGIINGKPGLFCQTVLKGDVTLEPISKSKVLKDLITKKGEGQN
jgi:hypothetical protein